MPQRSRPGGVDSAMKASGRMGYTLGTVPSVRRGRLPQSFEEVAHHPICARKAVACHLGLSAWPPLFIAVAIGRAPPCRGNWAIFKKPPPTHGGCRR